MSKRDPIPALHLPRPTPAQLLEGVLALGRDVHLGMDARALAERFVRGALELFPGRLVAIRLADPRHPGAEHPVVATAGARLVAAAARGPLVLKRSSLDKTGLAAEAVTSGLVALSDAAPAVFEGAAAGFSVPLVAGGDLYGTLDVGYPEGADLAAEDEPLVIPIANHLSVALGNVRLHAETALLRDYLGQLIEHAGALILGVDRRWRITVFNQAISRLTGVAAGEIMGADVRAWLPEAERSKLAAEIAYAFAGRHATSVDIELPVKGGEPVRTVWTIAAVRSGSGAAVDAVVAVGQDQTQIKSLERQVVQAEKLATLGQLAAGVVHELNNPLTSIIAYADYLAKKLGAEKHDPADVDKVRRILEGAERILNFSRDLVEYAKPTPARPDRVALSDVVRQSLSFCEHLLKRPGLQLVTELADLPPILAVRGQLQQVVINLVTNAVHALPQGRGRLRLRTFARSARHAALLVEDDGAGIRAEDLARIFEPFFTTKTDGKGTGLGLSIVKNIVERHHGSITVDSAPGRGTVFTIVLPVGDEAAPAG